MRPCGGWRWATTRESRWAAQLAPAGALWERTHIIPRNAVNKGRSQPAHTNWPFPASSADAAWCWVQAEGGEWKEDLMFKVPRDHQEILRLEGRYKRWGSLQAGQRSAGQGRAGHPVGQTGGMCRRWCWLCVGCCGGDERAAQAARPRFPLSAGGCQAGGHGNLAGESKRHRAHPCPARPPSACALPPPVPHLAAPPAARAACRRACLWSWPTAAWRW
jgi:hypothetical protein